MDKRDYEEPRCPMDNSMWVAKKTVSIPADRVIRKEDEYLARNDYAGAEKHLLYWLDEAVQGNDGRGQLLICSELMGLHRKQGNGDKAKEYSAKALNIVEELKLQDTVAGATAYLNSGTVYKAFGEPEKSLEYFERARELLEKNPMTDKGRMAGLYNNMALTLTDLGRFTEARELYMSAIDIMKDRSKADEAISWLNLADCAVLEKGLEKAEEEIQNCLERAEKLLDEVPEGEWSGDYAFACEKCAPSFDYYGWFFAAKKFEKRAAAIYAANQK